MTNKVRQLQTIETTFKIILFFLYAHEVFFTRIVTYIAIFLKDKIFSNSYPGFNNQFENKINIDLMAKFAVLVTWYIIEDNVQLKVISHCSPIKILFLIFFFTWRKWLILDAIMIITCTWAPNNLKLSFKLISKIYFITEMYTMLIFKLWIFFVHHYCSLLSMRLYMI